MTAVDDLIADILGRIRACCSPKAAEKLDLASIEAEVRRDWGGERHYVARSGETARKGLPQRDRQIREQYRRGERVRLLARRWGLSERRVRQIVKEGGA